MSYNEYLKLLENFSLDENAFDKKVKIYFDYILIQAKFYENTKIDGEKLDQYQMAGDKIVYYDLKKLVLV